MFSLSGLALLAAACVLPLLSSTVRQDPKIRSTLILVLFLRQLVTIAHIIFGPLPTVNKDPMAFQAYAANTGAYHIGGNVYAKFLRTVYDSLGSSHLLGCEISQLGFSLGLIAFINIIVLLGYRDIAPQLIILFGLLPSVSLNTSVVLREGLQVGFFLSLIYGLLRIKNAGMTPSVLLIPVCSAALVWLHNGFAPYLAFVLPLACLWAMGSRPSVLIIAVATGLFFIATMGAETVVSHLQDKSEAFEEIVGGEGLQYIDQYAKKVGRGREIRTAFSATLDFSSPTAILKTGPAVLSQYLFAPFPWQLRGAYDLYGVIESTVRLLLFFLALASIRTTSREERSYRLFLLFMFLTMETAWAAGTANWGTAFRHRAVAWGILVVLGAPAIFTNSGSSAQKGSRRSELRAKRKASRVVQNPAERKISGLTQA